MIRKDAWDSGELQILYDLVNELEWFPRARLALANRTENAIRTKMSNLRAEAGIVPGIIGPRAMFSAKAHRAAVSAASTRLREAMLGMAA